jgi:hypothetical protein
MQVTKEEWYVLHYDHPVQDIKYWPYKDSMPSMDEMKTLASYLADNGKDKVIRQIKDREVK